MKTCFLSECDYFFPRFLWPPFSGLLIMLEQNSEYVFVYFIFHTHIVILFKDTQLWSAMMADTFAIRFWDTLFKEYSKNLQPIGYIF